MDSDSSTKFIGSLTKFLQSLCNGYVEFDTGVELIGHIYLSVDTGKKIDYILNEKVCKSDNSVTFISNSFHALPAEKLKPPSNKKSTLEEKNLDKENKKEDGEIMIVDSGDSAPHSSNTGTVSTRSTAAARSTASPNQTRTSSISGTKRPGSPLTPRRAPTPPQRRPSTPPSQRRSQLSGAKGPVGSPGSSKPTVPSSPSSSSQDNIPSPASRLLNRNENIAAQPNSQPSTDNAGGESESDTLIPASILSVNPDLSSFLGTISGRENQSISLQEQRPDLTDDDTKPDTDVTFIKEEFPTSPPSCAQAGNSGQSAGRSVEDQLTDSGSSSGLFPVMLHQNTAAFPGSNAGFPQGFPQLGGTASSSQRSGFNQPIPSTSTSQSTADLFANPVPGTSHSSQDGGASDPSVYGASAGSTGIGATHDAAFRHPQIWKHLSVELTTGHRGARSNQGHLLQHHDVFQVYDTGSNQSRSDYEHDPATFVQLMSLLSEESTSPSDRNAPAYEQGRGLNSENSLRKADLTEGSMPGANKGRYGMHFPLSASSLATSNSKPIGRGCRMVGVPELQCRRCGRQYQQNCSLLRHRRNCEGRFHLECPVCSRKFYRRDVFKNHMKIHHGAPENT